MKKKDLLLVDLPLARRQTTNDFVYLIEILFTDERVSLVNLIDVKRKDQDANKAMTMLDYIHANKYNSSMKETTLM
jgi:hypothetical protein